LHRSIAIPFLLASTVLIAAAPIFGTWGFAYATMDRSVRPGDDFFAHAEGTWLKTAVIQPDRTTAGYHTDLADRVQRDIRVIVADASAHPTTPARRQIAEFYAAWMDESGIEARGIRPLTPYLRMIDGVGDRASLVRLMMRIPFAGPFSFDITEDAHDPTREAAYLSQAQLTLPARDYYLLPDERYAAVRRAYRAYIVQVETLAGFSDPQGKADRIVALETSLARDQWSPDQDRDADATHNVMNLTQLAALAPGVNWREALDAAGLNTTGSVVVSEPSAITAAARAIGDTPLQTWRDYLAFRFVSDHAQFLPHAFDAAHFELFDHVLNGATSSTDRETRGIRLLNASLGEAIGRLYAERHWSAETERRMSEMVGDLRAAYAEQIGHASWMDAQTRKVALEKLARLEVRVGHPKRYIDYAAMPISRTNPLANSVNAARFDWEMLLRRLGRPVDRDLWAIYPQTVNAINDAPLNQITFGAALLQPPIFDPEADAAANYGAAGAIIGHEIGHDFDDQGRRYDPDGRLRDWWSPPAAAQYTRRAEMLRRQFDGYEPLPGLHVNGRLTLGENLGDLSGLEAAHLAYHRYLARHGGPKTIDGLTADQRFFLSYAQCWQGKDREGALRTKLLTNPHSPWAYRVNGIIRNVDAWYAAFGVAPNDRLYLPSTQRVRLW
jgi:endothelin-converting enzyme/putative endopeptidase